MAKGSVFLVSCELAGDSPPLRREGYAGAHVTCLVSSEDIREAIWLATEALDEDEYEIVDIYSAVRFDAEDWQDDDEMISLAEQTRSDTETRYSTFNTWGH
ncbi:MULTISPECIES: hypothetical protein [Novosphingobium]|uniref:Uncharacterized protein n=1 Tax=Novosphingobium mathurense TaxID=428990 RepID=A0A1U6HBM6_9SPHN|nr:MULTISPECIES: hypothetical protein [Novosphingobium]CDO36634.1 hypothetical protein SPHV1_2380028 [Novosphingobium sp. KN65.2]SLJ93020.1 hypothetical protein SAMN06295987_10237 [Novosphingobium mathurense]